MKQKKHLFWALLWCMAAHGPLSAQEAVQSELATAEDAYYKMVTVALPEDVLLEVGGICRLPNGNIAASTRRGDVYIVENPYSDVRPPHVRKFATGLHEALGLAYFDNSLYVAQRGELTRLRDKNGDGKADSYETVYAWPLSGHYHEYSFGPVVAPDGSMFVTGNVAFGDNDWWNGQSKVPWRGWTMRITPDGKMEPWATGMRSPCGIGFYKGQFFYGDNQGDWMGSGGIVHVEKGDFTGHPGGLRWATQPNSPVSVRLSDIYSRVNPKTPPIGGPYIKPENDTTEVPKPLFEVAAEVKGVKTPAVWLPHGIFGISTTEIVEDVTDGNFGPFAGQIFVGDQGQSKIMRVSMEQVKGVWQGVAFGFREGFQCGVLRMCWGSDGSMFCGETNRGWGSSGTKTAGLQRLVWTGKVPFEMKNVRAMPDGFEVEFTQPVDKSLAADPDQFEVTSFIYKYHPVYGSPVVNQKSHIVRGVIVSEDGQKARLVVDSLRENYIFELKAAGVKSYFRNEGLLHNVGYYTLNRIPDGDKLNLPPRTPKPKNTDMGDAGHHMHHDHADMNADEPDQPATPVAVADKPAAEPTKSAAEPAKPKPAAPVKLAKRQTKLPADWEKADVSFTMGTKPGMKYDKTLLTVKAGQKVKLTFRNNDDMPHNFVLVGIGAADEVGNAAVALGLKGADQNYIPSSSKIIAHTRLTGPGAADTIYFYAPTKPGDYTYVCTVPGHAPIMRGTLRVTK